MQLEKGSEGDIKAQTCYTSNQECIIPCTTIFIFSVPLCLVLLEVYPLKSFGLLYWKFSVFLNEFKWEKIILWTYYFKYCSQLTGLYDKTFWIVVFVSFGWKSILMWHKEKVVLSVLWLFCIRRCLSMKAFVLTF